MRKRSRYDDNDHQFENGGFKGKTERTGIIYYIFIHFKEYF